jgi:hypothetical protein
VFVTPTGGGGFAAGVLAVTLRYLRNAGADHPVLAVAGNSADEVVSLEVDAGGVS